MKKPTRSTRLTFGDVLRGAAGALMPSHTDPPTAASAPADESITTNPTTPPQAATTQEQPDAAPDPQHQPPEAAAHAPSDAGPRDGHADPGAEVAPAPRPEPQLAGPPAMSALPAMPEPHVPAYLVRLSDCTLFPVEAWRFLTANPSDRQKFRATTADEEKALAAGGHQALVERVRANEQAALSMPWLQTTGYTAP